MTQIVVTLENGVDSNLLRKMIENMKGVLSAKISKSTLHRTDSKEEWISRMQKLSNGIDTSLIDTSDERSNYILSK